VGRGLRSEEPVQSLWYSKHLYPLSFVILTDLEISVLHRGEFEAASLRDTCGCGCVSHAELLRQQLFLW